MAKRKISWPKNIGKLRQNADFTNLKQNIHAKLSWSKYNSKLTKFNADLTSLKQNINVNAKTLKACKRNILLTLPLIFLTFFTIDRLILTKTIQNANTQYKCKNAIHIYQMFNEEIQQKSHEKIKDLEVLVNNLMLRLRYSYRIINTRQIRFIKYSESVIRKLANLSEIENDDDSNTTPIILNLDDSTIPSATAQSLADQNYVLKRNISKISDIILPIMSPISLIKNNLIEPEIKDLSRQKRAILKIETQNHTTTKGEKDGNDTVDIQRESQARKLWRDEGKRGKKRQNRRRPKRSRRRLGPAVVTFVGAIPEQDFKNTVYVGPWVKSSRNNSSYDLSKFHLKEDNYSIEISMSGLYMISVQIFYFGKSINHSYWVLLSSEGSSIRQKLITCAIASISAASEVSCYTGVTTYLQRGDRLSIQQQERNRLVNMREGYSQVQLVLLAKGRHRRGLT